MSSTFWIVATLICIGIHSFYSMLEMAVVSFNKVRLQYYVSQGIKRARWIDHLISRPARLFGTTLLGVNIALQVGSECSRMVYLSFGLDPDFAPLTQVFLVLIFAELAPMFAARRFAEHVAMLGIPLIYASSKLMLPFIWLIGGITKIFGPKEGSLRALSREELEHIVERHDEFNLLVSNIFSFRKQTARDAMTPLPLIPMIPAHAKVAEMRKVMGQGDVPSLPLYYRSRANIIAMSYPHDLVTIDDNQQVRPYTRPPWFITDTTPLLQILTQFRTNNESVAVILDQEGHACGLLTLDDILEEIFGEELSFPLRRVQKRKTTQLIERTFSGDKTVESFNREYDANLPQEDETLSELITHYLGTSPEEGDTAKIGDFEFKIIETTLLGAKTIQIKSLR